MNTQTDTSGTSARSADQQPISIKVVYTHPATHLDEWTNLWQACRYGQDHFANLDEAAIEFCDAGYRPADGRSADQHLLEGALYIGTGGGRFDEHPDEDRGRKVGDTAASLMARFLGIQNRPELSGLLRYVTRDDLNGDRSPFNFARVVILLNNAGVDPLWTKDFVFTVCDAIVQFGSPIEAQLANGLERLNELLVSWADGRWWPDADADDASDEIRLYCRRLSTYLNKVNLDDDLAGYGLATLAGMLTFTGVTHGRIDEIFTTIFDAEYKLQRDFFTEAKSEFEKSVKHSVVINGETAQVALIRTENNQASTYGHSQEAGAGRSDITVQYNPRSGQVFIKGRKGLSNVIFDDLIRNLRTKEMQIRGLTAPAGKSELLSETGPRGLGVWHYPKGMNIIMNGSRSAPNAEPTRLTDDSIYETVLLVANQDAFAPGRSHICRAHGCTASVRPCNLAAYELDRCLRKGLVPPSQLVRR